MTGEMGAAEIRGIQGQGVMSQAKHYVAYDTDATNVMVDDQTLHEVYVLLCCGKQGGRVVDYVLV